MNDNGDKFSVLKTWPIASWPWPKIVIFVPLIPALPFADDVLPSFFEIFQGGAPFFAMKYARTDVARNKAAQALLDSEFTHILMLDTDHPHPPNIVQKLARRVIENPDRLVVAAMAFRRGEPYDPIVWIKQGDNYYTVHDWDHGACFEVDVIGTPAMLIHRSVFEQVSRPWFWYDYELINDPEFNWPTEDVGFCRKVREAGIKIWCDSDVITPHMRSVTVDERTYRTWCQMHQDKINDPIEEIPT